MSWSKLAVFAGGVLFGTAGIKALGSKDAKKAYTQVTAAALRAKDCVMDATTKVREGAEDVYEDAKRINAERAAAEVAKKLGIDEYSAEVLPEDKARFVREAR